MRIKRIDDLPGIERILRQRLFGKSTNRRLRLAAHERSKHFLSL